MAKSNWVYLIVDYRGWAHFHQSDAGIGLSQSGMAMQVFTLLLKPQKSGSTNDDYWEWVNQYVIKPLKNSEPLIYKQMLGICKREIIRQLNDRDLWNRLESSL